MENELLLPIYDGLCTFLFCGIGKLIVARFWCLGTLFSIDFKCGLKVLYVIKHLKSTFKYIYNVSLMFQKQNLVFKIGKKKIFIVPIIFIILKA